VFKHRNEMITVNTTVGWPIALRHTLHVNGASSCMSEVVIEEKMNGTGWDDN